MPAGKNEDSLIRVQNLKAFMARRGWEIKDLMAAARYGVYPYWRDLITGRKSFGERAARKIEGAIEGMTRGCLDGDASRLSPRAVLLGLEFDKLPNGELKESVYERFRKVLGEALRGTAEPAVVSESAPRGLLAEPRQTLKAGR